MEWRCKIRKDGPTKTPFRVRMYKRNTVGTILVGEYATLPEAYRAGIVSYTFVNLQLRYA